jgi:hypothetical protein
LDGGYGLRRFIATLRGFNNQALLSIVLDTVDLNQHRHCWQAMAGGTSED